MVKLETILFGDNNDISCTVLHCLLNKNPHHSHSLVKLCIRAVCFSVCLQTLWSVNLIFPSLAKNVSSYLQLQNCGWSSFFACEWSREPSSVDVECSCHPVPWWKSKKMFHGGKLIKLKTNQETDDTFWGVVNTLPLYGYREVKIIWVKKTEIQMYTLIVFLIAVNEKQSTCFKRSTLMKESSNLDSPTGPAYQWRVNRNTAWASRKCFIFCFVLFYCLIMTPSVLPRTYLFKLLFYDFVLKKGLKKMSKRLTFEDHKRMSLHHFCNEIFNSTKTRRRLIKMAVYEGDVAFFFICWLGMFSHAQGAQGVAQLTGNLLQTMSWFWKCWLIDVFFLLLIIDGHWNTSCSGLYFSRNGTISVNFTKSQSQTAQTIHIFLFCFVLGFFGMMLWS